MIRIGPLACGAIVAAATVAAFAVAASDAPEQAQLKLGKKLYGDNCAECHGSRGEGNGPKAKERGYHPRNFTLGAFRCRCTPTGEPPTDEDLLRTIANGLPGTPMAGFPGMPPAQRAAIVQYVKTLSPKAFAAGNQPSCAAPPGPPPTSTELVAEGNRLYRLMQCAKCHGPSGRGDGPSATALKDDWGRPIAPYNFASSGDFKCGNDDRDLFRTLQTGMTGAPMPSFVAALAFGSDAFPAEQLQTLGTADEAADLARCLGAQPTAAEVGAMSEIDRRELLDRRTWALVRYLRSLAAPRR